MIKADIKVKCDKYLGIEYFYKNLGVPNAAGFFYFGPLKNIFHK
jgi:hypothetical protein